MAAFDPQFLWNGLVVGSIIAVAALGLTLIFGILNFINIAYGDYMALGAYVAFAANVQYDLNIVVAALLGMVGMAVGALVLDKLVFERFRSRSAIVLLVVSIGLAFVLRNLIRIVWGTGNRRFSGPIEAAPQVLGVRMLPDQVAILVISVAILAGTYVLLRRTRIGIAMRAASDDTDLARVRGIDTERLVTYVWLAGGAIAGIAGILLGLDAQIRPNMGFTSLIPIFAAVILGGIGDPIGAVAGGYAIGVTQELSVMVIPSEYKPAIGLLLLIIGLLSRPEGLFGEATR
ncbi:MULTISPECIES: branched-chain amino acid ABC transporter permease [Halorussus]|uniref:branched-chain amino acid ABC transporter permease n=1 Tax=Halorussus TaxID=1070314 RepID=UPI000E21386A|nr:MULTISPECIES: branched-chain amino acid ABC transporter permease [Halorussus]NHN61308.1 branched-chain amino acid ABC transporter permease [Halorussus sp. JP-T4]